MMDPNVPQFNETLIFAGYFPNGVPFNYSWPIHSEHMTMPEKPDVPYHEAREMLYKQYEHDLANNQVEES